MPKNVNISFSTGCLLAFILLFAVYGMNSQTKRSDGVGNWEEISWSPTGVPTAMEDVEIRNDSVIIPYGTTVTINNLEIGKDGNLVVYGNLIVKGNANMTNNSVGYSMGPSSTVVIYGDFEINNQVNLSLSSYLVIYGNFTNNGSSRQGDLNIDDASIYIFGTVDGTGFPDDFGCEEDYSGTTPDVEENCDYGNENDYEDNQDEIPPEIIDLINCFDLSSIQNEEICPGQSATFSVNNYSNVTYQWQVQTLSEPGIWTNTGTNNNTLNISDATLDLAGNKYRVVVTPTDEAECKISISRNVFLQVTNENEWIGLTNSDWNTASNWACGYIPEIDTNVLIPAGTLYEPVLESGDFGKVKNISVENGALLTIISNTLQVSGIISSVGNIDASSGSLEVLGSAAIDIPANSFLNNQVKNLTINNISGVSLLGDLEISGTLFLKNGNLNSNSFLTLISNSDKTALIDGSGNGEVIGSIYMQRFLSSSFGYKYVSSPFNNTIVDDFSAYIDLSSTFPHVYSYDENREDSELNDATGWTSYTTRSNPFNTLEGYALNFGNASDPSLIEISGEVNNGDYSRRLQNSDGLYTKGFSLVGNPYPSPIDWDSSGWTKQNIDDAIYFFEASSDDQYTGTYTSYVNGISSTGNTSASIIPSMQGFFVKVSDGFSSGNLGVSNEVRVNDFSQGFYKNHSVENTKNYRSLVRLTAKLNDQQAHDAMVVYFSPFTSDDFEKDKDALKMMNTSQNVPNLYSLAPSAKKLSVNGLPDAEENLIPLGLMTEEDGWITIGISNIENISATYIYLIDRTENTFQDLRNSKEYKFKLKKGVYESRFKLLLTNKRFSNTSDLKMDVLSVSYNRQTLLAKVNLNSSQKGVLRLINVNGQVVDNLEIRGENIYELSGITSSGIYFITLNTEGEKFVEKVLINL